MTGRSKVVTHTGPGARTGRPPGHTAAQTRNRLLEAILEAHRRTSLWPGRNSLARSLHLSPRLVARYRTELIAQGLLPAKAAAEPGLRWLQPTIRLLGVTAGGPPHLAAVEGDPLDLVSLITGGNSDCFGLRVTGSSMAGDNITPGSIAIIQPQETADDGAIVLVRISDPATSEPCTTIKRLAHDGEGRVVLRASDGQALDVDTRDVVVIGKVVSVVHQIG